MKKLLPTALALLVFVGLLAWVKIGGFDGETDEEEPPEKEETVWEMNPKAIRSVTVEKKDGVLSFKKDGDKWRATEPQPFPVDESALDSHLSSLASLKGEPVSSGSEKRESFGLQAPSTVLKIGLIGGEVKELHLGDETPVGDKVYAQPAGETAVYMVDQWLFQNYDDPVAGFMDKQLWSIDTDKLVSVKVNWEGKTFEISREKEEWKLNGKEIAEDRLNAIVSGLNAVEAVDVPADALPEGTTFSLVIRTGKKTEQWTGANVDDRVFVHKEGADFVYPVEKEGIEAFVSELEQQLGKKE